MQIEIIGIEFLIVDDKQRVALKKFIAKEGRVFEDCLMLRKYREEVKEK